ncbi:MAG: arginase family protein [Candidatus Nanoarchaeia archaeon]
MQVLKVPFDSCVVEKERRGQSLAPNIILQELNNLFQAEEILNKIEIVEVQNLNDFSALQQELENFSRKNLEQKNFFLALGGDHSITYGLTKSFSNFKKPVLIYLDAHLDCQDDFLPPTHEDVLRAIINKSIFSKIIHLGLRNYTKKELSFAKNKIEIFTSVEIFNSNDKVLQNLKRTLSNCDALYISIGVDVFDPAFAPGTGWAEPFGLFPIQVLRILELLLNTKKVKGADIVETNPKCDINRLTARLAANLSFKILKYFV